MTYRNKLRISKIPAIIICYIIIAFFNVYSECRGENNTDTLQSKDEIYFYLDNVTPFNDLNNLIDEIDYLKDNGIKFFIEASAIFVNQDLKAMGRFAECLRYAQASGGKVILKFPIINSRGADAEPVNGQLINEKVKVAFNNYTNYWVYPVGISISESLLHREDLKDPLEYTNTLFLDFQDNTPIDSSNKFTKPYNNFIQKVNSDYYIKNNKTIIYDRSAICVESNCNFENFKKNVVRILNKEIILTSNSKLTSYVKFDNEVKSDFKGIFFNNENVTQERFITQEEYKNIFSKGNNKEETSVKKDLTYSNKSLEILSAVSSVIFLIILLLSKNIERKRFFK